MQYLGIDWGTRRAAWCALSRARRADRGHDLGRRGRSRRGWSRRLGPEVRGCIEMMSGAVWVRDQLCRRAAGRSRSPTRARSRRSRRWPARPTASTRACSPTSRAATWSPTVWVPSLDDRAIRERLRRRAHLIRLRTSAINRTFGLLTQWGLRRNLTALRQPGAHRRARRARRPGGLAATRSPTLLGGHRRPRPPARAARARAASARARRRARRSC